MGKRAKLKMEKDELILTSDHEKKAMARVEPESSENVGYKFNTLFKYLAILTMPLEGAFFFGTIMGWPNLAELYKKQGVYVDLCDASNSTTTDNVTGIEYCNELHDFSAGRYIRSLWQFCFTLTMYNSNVNW